MVAFCQASSRLVDLCSLQSCSRSIQSSSSLEFCNLTEIQVHQLCSKHASLVTSFRSLLHRLWNHHRFYLCFIGCDASSLVSRSTSLKWWRQLGPETMNALNPRFFVEPVTLVDPHYWPFCLVIFEHVSLAVSTCVNINSWESVFSPILLSRLLHIIYNII